MAILVVDDSRDFRDLIEKILTEAGYSSLLFAESAKQAFEVLGMGPVDGERSTYEVDLILMDRSSAGTDGIEATQRIKAVTALHDIPIILLTSDSDLSHLDAAFKAGANDFIVKPPESVELCARVRSALTLKLEIDARKLAANELRKLSYVVEQNPAFIMILDTEQRIIYVNGAFTEDMGYCSDDVLGRSIEVLKCGGHDEEFYDEVWETVRAGKVWRGDVCLKAKSGKNVWQLQSMIPIVGSNGGISHFVAVKVDDTERRLVEESLWEREAELELLNSELHELTIEMSELEDRERKSFADILHEDIGQNLATMQLILANRLADVEAGPDGESFSEAQSAAINEFLSLFDTLISSSIRATRTLTSEIYPKVPYGTGITDAVQWYGNLSLKQSGARLKVELDPGFDVFDEKVKEVLLRVIRESLQNIRKHSEASEVEVSGTLSPKGLVLSIQDNGIGFSVDKIRGKKGRGIGTLLMRERVKGLGGSLNILSEPGLGTTVTVNIGMGELSSK